MKDEDLMRLLYEFRNDFGFILCDDVRLGLKNNKIQTIEDALKFISDNIEIYKVEIKEDTIKLLKIRKENTIQAIPVTFVVER